MLGWIDILIMVAYFGAMGIVGLYYSGKNSDTDEYFLGGRRTLGWMAGISMLGTLLSSITFLAYPADSFKTTWIRLLPMALVPVGSIIAAYFFLPFYRQTKMTSAYEYIGKRFGPITRAYFSFSFLVLQLFRISTVLYLMSILMAELTGWNIVVCVLVSGGLVSAYTIIGGFDAVVLTVVIQTIVLVAGALVCFGVIVHQLPGGIGQIFSVAITDGKLALADLIDGEMTPLSWWGVSLREKTGIMLLVIGLTNFLAVYASDQTMVQRYCSTPTDKEARKAIYVCGFGALPMWTFFMLIGTSLYVFFKQFPQPEAIAMLDGSRDPEGILPFFVVRYMPNGFKGVVLAAVLSAAMSTLSSGINAISTVGVVDFYKKMVKNKSDRHYLKAAYLISACAGIIMIGGTFVLLKADTMTLQDTLIIVTAIIGGGGLGIYCVGFFTNKGNDIAAASGAAASILYSLWVTLGSRGCLPGFMTVPFDLYYTAFLGNFITFIAVYGIGALFTSMNNKNLRCLNIWQLDKEEA